MIIKELAGHTLDLRPTSAKTRLGYASVLRTLLLDLAEREAETVTPLDVQRWVNAQTVSPSRVRQAYSVLHQAYTVGQQFGFVQTNPCQNIRLPRLPRREVDVLTAEQLHALGDAAGRYGNLILFLGHTGVRWGEATALTYADVSGRRVRVRRAVSEVNGHLVYGSTKTHQNRTVIKPGWLDLGEGPADQLIFRTGSRCPIRLANFRTRFFHPACDAAGVPRIRIHDLRHTCASLMIAAGVDVKTVSTFLGHSTVTLTLDTYAHLYTDSLIRASDAIA